MEGISSLPARSASQCGGEPEVLGIFRWLAHQENLNQNPTKIMGFVPSNPEIAGPPPQRAQRISGARRTGSVLTIRYI
jgi:hypothetical protein